jgi:hypothetical protein
VGKWAGNYDDHMPVGIVFEPGHHKPETGLGGGIDTVGERHPRRASSLVHNIVRLPG